MLNHVQVRSENGYGFLKPGLKTGVGNGIFWSEIGSGFGDAGGTPYHKFQGVPPAGSKLSTKGWLSRTRIVSRKLEPLTSKQYIYT